MKTAFFVAALALAPAALPAGLKLGLRPPTFLPVPDEHAISVPEATMLAENPGDGYLCAPSVVAVRSAAAAGCAPERLALPLLEVFERGGDAVAKPTVEHLRAAAAADCVEAQLILAVLHRHGLVLPYDLDEARRWLLRAAALGDPSAMSALGEDAALGLDKAADFPQALSWHSRAAALGDPHGCLGMAKLCHDGLALQKSPAEGLAWLRQAAAAGVPEALYLLGVLRWRGDGLGRSPAAALDCFRRASDKGDPHAQNALGVCYAEGRFVERSLAKALPLLRASAAQGDREGRYNYARLGEQGLAPELRDPIEIGYLYRHAAEAGIGDAAYRLALLILDGPLEDGDVGGGGALRWLSLAASGGHPEAIQRLEKEMADLAPHPDDDCVNP